MVRPLSRLRVPLLGLLLLTVATPIRAQETGAADAPAPVRIDFPDGKPLHFTQTIREDLLSDVGMIPMDRSILLRRDVSLTPVERTEDGGWKVTWTIHRIRGRVVSTVFDAELDSAGRRDGEANLLVDPLLALGGATFEVVLGPRGAVQSVAGLDDALKGAVAHVPEDEQAFLRMMMARIYTQDRVRHELAELLPYAPLPEAAARSGSTWPVTSTIPYDSGIAYHTKSTMTAGSTDGTRLDWTAMCEGSATFEKGRTSTWGEMLSDDEPDRFDVGLHGTLATTDGFPVRQSGWFWVDAIQETEDGEAWRFLMRRRIVTERVDARTPEAIRAGAATAGLDAFELTPPEHPYRFAATLQWLGIRAGLDVKADEIDIARRRYDEAIQLAEALASGEQTTAETDGVRGGWAQRVVRLLHESATVQFDQGNWTAAAKGWKRLSQHPIVRAGVDEGDGWMVWECARSGVMRAQALSESDLHDEATAQLEASSAVLAAGRKALPDDHELTDLHGWLFERWAVLRQDAGDTAGALARAMEGLAIRDALDAALSPEKRSPEQRIDQLWGIADYAIAAGKPTAAAKLLSRASSLAEPLAAKDEGYASYRKEIDLRRTACERIAGGADAGSPELAIEMAYLLHSMKRHAEAVANFTAAFADEAVRTDWDRHNLYNAACSAALAHAAAKAADKPALAKQCLAWLTPHVKRLRDLAASDDEEQVGYATGYLTHVREKDEDLASVRGLPEFKKLFE